jgi:NAD(P)-dependent dehydrogenase (short-subunit alcohol dehydrogenase family)
MSIPRRGGVVLVTGCSSGIGKACCERLSRSGRRVYGASRTTCEPEGWRYVPMDVRDEASVEQAVAAVLAAEGRIDALVHGAGISLAGSIEDTTVEEAKGHFDINYFGTVRVVRAVLPQMRAQSGGRIIVIGSIGGLIALPYISHYSAAKFALDGLVEALRMEVGPLGVEACIVHPGDFNTGIIANQSFSAKAYDDQSAYAEACRSIVELYDVNVRRAPPPDVVAKRVDRLLSRRRLPVRSLVGSPIEIGAVRLKSVISGRGFEALFRKAYKL